MGTRCGAACNQHRRHGGAAVLLLLAAYGLSAGAQETNHYPNGTSGILAGSVPGPGLYYLMYNVFYNADRLENDRSFGITVFANVHRIIHVTQFKFLGAELSWNVAMPLVYRRIQLKTFDVYDSTFEPGDLNLEPLVLEWRGPQWDFGIGTGLFAPTGNRDDEHHPAQPGKDFWTYYPIVAGTWFFDPERTWSASFLSRYEFHSERSDKDIKAGDDFSLEWGVGKKLGTLIVGVSGYAQWQVTNDTGADVTYRASVHDRVFNIGPEVQCFLPQYGFGFNLRYGREFGVRDRPERGAVTVLTLVKPLW